MFWTDSNKTRGSFFRKIIFSLQQMDYSRFVFLTALASIIEDSFATSCVVDQFSVKSGFDHKRYSGKWYAVAKKDPEGLFLQDNISAEYFVDDEGTMTALSKGRVKLFGHSINMAGHGDHYWVIDTDYDNYAITYACRRQKADGTCDDGYAIVFSRSPLGLPPNIQRIVRRKQEEICLSGQFEPVLQSGACP
ncbi:purpurin-like [Chiloscyllium plagiosum]|uniref:purpurin-like n=1 Tax=Chiloscyllium plagiosum TaxID=36176 RepID=UPI001CB84467|nr:purpurin-like [Chiloscyllium plagiosum]